MIYHQSVYSNATGFDPDQLSAMPSVHVGWAILVAIAVITTVRSRWRWLGVLYPAMTTLAVIVTANHFWLDGVAAAIILLVVLAAQSLVRRLLAARLDGWQLSTAGDDGRLGYGCSSSMTMPSVAASTGAATAS